MDTKCYKSDNSIPSEGWYTNNKRCQCGIKLCLYISKLEMCTQQPLAKGNDMRMQIFSFPPTFQETAGSQVIQWLLWQQFNSNLFCGFSKQ